MDEHIVFYTPLSYSLCQALSLETDGSSSHLVEIDLLRENTPMHMIGVEETSDYRIIVSRATTRPMASIIMVPEKLPTLLSEPLGLAASYPKEI